MTKSTQTTGTARVPVNVGFLWDATKGVVVEMESFDHWVLWRFEKRGGELTKVPYGKPNGLGNRDKASSTDSRTWLPFETVIPAYESGGWDGIGFVLSSGDPFVVIDFDKCRNPATGVVDAKVIEYIERFSNRYVEVSPSGTGLHLVTVGKLRDGAKKGAYEAYGQERYITVTGEVFDV
jgi:putative DNA primase/helicase